MLGKWLREPLLHFLLIGAALFIAYASQNKDSGSEDQVNKIIISEADVGRLIVRWEKKWLRPPTPIELDRIIEQQVREQVLYRQALALGLDKNDPVVRRRLAQKLEFVSSDLATQIEPSEEQLRSYFIEHPDKFEIPARISFVQVYLNSDRRGDQVYEDANRLLKELTVTDVPVDYSNIGDPFMLDQKFENLTGLGISRLFGNKFADELLTLPSGKWLGPVVSGLGLHLVLISDKQPVRQPMLDSVREKVVKEWRNQQRQTLDQAFYQSLRQRFEIVIPVTGAAAKP